MLIKIFLVCVAFESLFQAVAVSLQFLVIPFQEGCFLPRTSVFTNFFICVLLIYFFSILIYEQFMGAGNKT